MRDEIEKQAAIWCQPVADDSFCGQPSRYAEDYDTLLAEIAKLESIHGEPCDWGVVYRCADALLRGKTKDMTVLGALCVALHERQGFGGLAAGLVAFRWLVENHSRAMYPGASRRRGRAGAFTWLVQTLTVRLEQPDVAPAEHEALEICQQEFDRLSELLRNELAELHPRVGPVSKALKDLVDRTAPVPEPAEHEPEPEESGQPAPDPTLTETTTAVTSTESVERPPAAPAVQPAAVQAQTRPSEPPPPSIPGRIGDETQAQQVLDLVVAGLRRLASFHLGRDPRHALGHHLAHLASFVGVVPDGDRSVASPSPRAVRAMQEALERGDHVEVYASLARMVEEGDIDLRVEWVVARALEAEGAEAAQQTVEAQVMDVVRRMGDLVGVTGELRQWVDGLQPAAAPQVEPLPVRSETAAPTGPAVPVDPLREVIREATDAARRDGLDHGCQLLNAALQGTGTKPERFRLRLALAALCIGGGAADLARPVLQDLYQELQEPVAEWERGLLVEVVTAILSCNRELEPSCDESMRGDLKAETSRMMMLLARVDPQAAYRERQRG